MFFRKKKYEGTMISVDSLNYDPDTDRILITFREDSKLSPAHIDEVIAMLDNIFKYKTIMLPHEIKDIIILHNQKE